MTGRPTLREPQVTSANSGEKAVFCTKIATDFVGDDADRVKRHAEDRGQLLFLAHDAARPGVKRIAPARSIIAADGGTRLHRHAGDAVDPGVEARHMGGSCKRLRRCFGVADLGIDHDVRQVIVEARGTELNRGQGGHHRRQWLILYDHLFGSIFCRRRRLGDDEGNGRADVARAIGREDVVWRDGHRRAVAVVQHDIGRSAGSGKVGNAYEAVGRRVPPVRTASTPRMAHAALVSIARIGACACGERATAP